MVSLPKRDAGPQLKFLGLFNSCNGVVSMRDILGDISMEKSEFTELQQLEIENFETALMQMLWVLAALDQCENEINEYSKSWKKRKAGELWKGTSI